MELAEVGCEVGFRWEMHCFAGSQMASLRSGILKVWNHLGQWTEVSAIASLTPGALGSVGFHEAGRSCETFRDLF